MSPAVERGGAALRDLLTTRLFDLRELEPARFLAWLEPHLEQWRRQPAFLLRSQIRDLRRAHPEVGALEEERRRAQAADEASPLYPRLEAVRRELAGADNAVAGLTHALGRELDAAERERLRRKLDRFRARAEELRQAERSLAGSSEPRVALNDLTARLDRLRAELGLDEMEARLRELQRTRGRSSGRSGKAFEEAAVAAVRAEVLPELGVRPDDPSVAVLRGVSLGAARTEIDQLVVRVGPDPGAPVEVLALVEAKRNLNDIAHGLHRRVENLAWLAGHAGGYDPELYRTASFPTARFEGVAVHARQGRRHRFTRESFRHFLPELIAGALPARLYLVTRPGPLWGVGSGGLARIAHRISSDEEWDPADPEYLTGLLEWCKRLAGAVEAPDVLREYAVEGEVGRRVLLLRD